jgi:hypothetical protein
LLNESKLVPGLHVYSTDFQLFKYCTSMCLQLFVHVEGYAIFWFKFPQWLPILSRIQFKVLLLALHNPVSGNFSDLIPSIDVFVSAIPSVSNTFYKTTFFIWFFVQMSLQTDLSQWLHLKESFLSYLPPALYLLIYFTFIYAYNYHWNVEDTLPGPIELTF